MCAGFVYCGLNCCCPLPPASPTLTSQQRSLTLNNISLLQSLTLGGSHKGYSSEPSVYHRMRNALHNATNDDASSIASAVVEEDEYVDSEDDHDDCKEDIITLGGSDEDYQYNMEPSSFAMHGTCDSDIDKDTEDEYEQTLSALIQIPSNPQIVEEEEDEQKEVTIQTIEDPYSMGNGIDDDECSGDEESGDEETVNEGTPLIINSHSNDDIDGSGNGIKSNNLP